MKRFFVSDDLEPGKFIDLSEEESRHALQVMRLEIGNHISVTNGKGRSAQAKIISITSDGIANLEILTIFDATHRPSLHVIQGQLKGPKMDWLVEKLTELGVNSILPAISKFTVAKSEKSDRWIRISQSALKQSGNCVAPKIFLPAPLKECLAEVENMPVKFFLDPNAPPLLGKLLREMLEKQKVHNIVLAIGPEGGFDTKEQEHFMAEGFVPARLSQQILRGETAAIAAVSIVMHEIDT